MEVNKTVYKKVTQKHSIEMACLFQFAGVSGKTLLGMYPMYSRASVYRHARKKVAAEEHEDKRKFNKGRPAVLNERDKRKFLRAIPRLRLTHGSFTSRRVAVEACVERKCSNRTVRRFLNTAGYKYRRSRKKGLMTKKDLAARVTFCQKAKRHGMGDDFWKYRIAFYLDGKGFEFKTNPMDQARAPRAREWRLRCEGLKLGCTAKGRKEGAVNANFMVGISYDKGVVLCKQYVGTITGEKVAEIVNNCFPEALAKSIDPKGKRILQDGCPRQNSKKAITAMDNVHAKILKIPARSPDLNPIENFFNLVSRKLRSDAIDKNISAETKEEFCLRVKNTLEEYPVEPINNIIKSMPKRIDMILKEKGNRIRY